MYLYHTKNKLKMFFPHHLYRAILWIAWHTAKNKCSHSLSTFCVSYDYFVHGYRPISVLSCAPRRARDHFLPLGLLQKPYLLKHFYWEKWTMEGLTIKETGFYEMLLEQRTILHSLAMEVAFDLVLAPFNEPTCFEHWYSATPPLFYPSRYPYHKDV